MAKDIKFADYKECVFNETTKHITQKGIKAYSHEIYTVKEEKIALHAFNDKRIILDNGIDSLAIGHYRAHNYISN